MATTKFEISKKERNSTSELIVRFSYDRKHSYRLHTNIWVPQTAWNSAKGKLIIPRMHGEEQKRLSQLQAEIEELANFLKSECIEAPQWADKYFWLKKIAEFRKVDDPQVGASILHAESNSNQGEDTIEAFKAFIKAKSADTKCEAHMDVTMRTVKRFMLYIKRNIRLNEWTSTDLDNFKNFLQIEHTFFDNGLCKKKYQHIYRNEPKSQPPRARGGNTIYSIMKRFRIMFNWCVKTGLLDKSPFSTIQLQGCVYGTPFYLTLDELNRLYQFDFSKHPKLAIQRDIFVLQSNQGMRVGDFYGLTASNLVNDAIEYIPGKTLHDKGSVVRVPLTGRAKEIINRYKSDNRISLMPFICEQKYNKAIKEMLRLAGINRIVTTLNTRTRLEEQHPIWEKASSHMARRNFIGNLYAKVQDPALISSMTGHSPGSRAFERYRAIHDEIKIPILKIFD